MLQILAATTNKHKIQEFQAMLDATVDAGRVAILSPDTIPGFPELVENGTTFEENARHKAGQAARYADRAAFADDSGLEVAVLKPSTVWIKSIAPRKRLIMRSP